jgi:hypothetical protein
MYEPKRSHSGLLAFVLGGGFGLVLILIAIGGFLFLSRAFAPKGGGVAPSGTGTPLAESDAVASEIPPSPTAVVRMVTETPIPVTALPSPVPIPSITPLAAATAPARPGVRLRTGSGPDALARRMPAEQFVLDGQLTEWRSAGIPLTLVHFGPESWQGPADLSGTAWLGWNEQNLLLAMDVQDDVHAQTQRGWEMFRGDSVEMWIDADLQGDFDQPAGNADDWQFGFSPGDFQLLAPEGVVYIPLRDVNLNRQILVNAQRTATGYTLEASIPWAMLQVQPQPGLVLGYTIDTSDNDLPGTAQQQTQVTHNPHFQFQSPTTFGNLILE